MNLYCNQPEIHCGISRFAFLILGGLLLASQLVFPSVTFATSTRTASTADPPQSLAQSEVAVVRLVFSYTPTPASNGPTAGNPVLCTSLGVLVKSFPASTSSTLNTWVLTDGSLLNTTPAPCAPSGSNSRGNATTTYTLSSINVYANTVYTGNTSTHALLGTYTAAHVNGFLCFATPCTNGAFLFAFHTDQLQPTLDVATANTTQQFGIALTSATSPTARPPVPLSSTAAALQFLNPTAVTPGAISNQNEVGPPFINTSGQMVAMQLQNNVLLTSSDYNTFVAQQSSFANSPANPLQLAWENGIAAYYSQNYHDAIKDFQAVESLNPNFKAAKTFELKATALNNSSSNPVSGTTVPSTENATFFGIPKSTFLIVGIASGILLLIVFLIIVSIWVRRRQELARLESEPAEALRNAEREVQQLQRNKLQLQTEYDRPPERRKDSTVNPQTPANLHCTTCGFPVLAGASYCPNGHYQLSPITRSASPMVAKPPESELPVIGKALPSSQITSQPQLGPTKEIVWNDLAIIEALKHLWEKAER